MAIKKSLLGQLAGAIEDTHVCVAALKYEPPSLSVQDFNVFCNEMSQV